VPVDVKNTIIISDMPIMPPVLEDDESVAEGIDMLLMSILTVLCFFCV